MEKEQLLNVGYDMIYLASCALHTQIPSQEMIERMDLSAVYKLAKNHSMQAITSVAIDSFVKANPDFSFGISDELIKKCGASMCKIEYYSALKKKSCYLQQG